MTRVDQKKRRRSRKGSEAASEPTTAPTLAAEAATLEREPNQRLCADCGEQMRVPTCGACGSSGLLDGRYELLEVVGRGALGTTYRARRTEDGSIVAVKEMAFRNFENLKAWELARRESDLLKQLEHPDIPRYRDSFRFGTGKHSAMYLAQDFVEGKTLSAELEHRRFDEAEVLKVFEQVANILEYLHNLSPPVIHRDIKPGNVMRRARDGRLSLIDFGSVRDVIKDEKLGGSTVTGTFGFMAPEQFTGDAYPATDIYALGVLGVVLLSRKEPSTMMGHGGLDWKRHVRVSPSMQALLERMLDPDPKKRVPGAEALRLEIKEVRRGRLAKQGSTQAAERSKKPLASHSRFKVALVALVAATLGWGVGRAVQLEIPVEPAAPPKVEVAELPESAGYHPSSSLERQLRWCGKGFAPACVDAGNALAATGTRNDTVRAAELYGQACNKLHYPGCESLARSEVLPPGSGPTLERAARYFGKECTDGKTHLCSVAVTTRTAADRANVGSVSGPGSD